MRGSKTKVETRRVQTLDPHAEAYRRLLAQYYFQKGYYYFLHAAKDYQLRLSAI